MDRLRERVVLVTGSATGVGEGIARRAMAEGATVVTHGRESETGIEGTLYVAGDLEDPSAPERIVAAVVAAHGRLDGLVNNAGVSLRGGIESSAAHFDRIMAINARAPFLMIQAARPFMAGGSVVNIGSSLSRQGAPNLVPYSMSKAALSTMTRGLSRAFAEERIRINGLNLGWTLTPNERALNVGSNGWAEDWPETIGRGQPFGRLLLPEDVAGVVAYLLSDEAAMVTGQVWDFDQQSFGG